MPRQKIKCFETQEVFSSIADCSRKIGIGRNDIIESCENITPVVVSAKKKYHFAYETIEGQADYNFQKFIK